MKKLFLKYGFFATLLLTYTSCIKDKPNKPVPVPVNISGEQKVYIVNEGNFMSANASVSLFDSGTGQVVEDYYATRNNHSLGDVAQSMIKVNNSYCIVVNNSGKIAVCNPVFNLKYNISGLLSPRYILPVSNQKAYVSDLYANAVHVVNLNTGVKTGSIGLPGWTEKMVVLYNKAYITNRHRKYLYVVNTINDVLTDSIYLGYNCGDIVLDKNDHIWTLGVNTSNPAVEVFLTRVNPLDTTDKKTIGYSNPHHAHSLCINATKDTLYYLNGGVRFQPIGSLLYPPVLVPEGTKNFYGLGVNPFKQELYVSDALDYVQKSNIYVFHSVTGSQIRMFKAGINAGSFYFE